jgi:hypothetical protein
MRTAAATIVAFVLWGVGLHVTGNDVQAAPADGALPLQPKQMLLLNTYVAARNCMRSAGIAADRRSFPEDLAKEFMVSVCGGSLRAFLRRDMSEKEAEMYVQAIAAMSYSEDVLRAR